MSQKHSKIYLTSLSCSNKKFQALDNPFLPYLRIPNLWTKLKQIGYCLKEENPRLRISMFTLSWRETMAADWKHKSVLKSLVASLNQMLEGKFADEQFSRLLVAMRISLKKRRKIKQ